MSVKTIGNNVRVMFLKTEVCMLFRRLVRIVNNPGCFARAFRLQAGLPIASRWIQS
ncbi:hypothetical protein [Candidatus Thiothrix anitrata]|uniref:Transposase DDE domain-containing protein n=1 Tax=Candidatus Thiothrix anitrata TaxID=2823902 RepID=A0ABX7X6J7_9GAMM|nr:hypothetical protein [Candidatus Thiothrix anitrata]QTR48735.1 hypothetical protein J8380_10560 [Candidatus Thiothrix anitrata]